MNPEENIENTIHIPDKNSLLDFRPSSRTVKVMPPDIGRIENKLAGSGIRVCAIPRDFVPQTVDERIFENDDSSQNISAVADAELKNHRLRTYLNPETLETAMSELSECEMICLAAGFLKWYDNESGTIPKFAPLILMPVDIVRETDGRYFTIKTSTMNSQLNRTLADFLLCRFDIDIPELRTYTDDGENINVQQLFCAVRNAVSEFSLWEVREMVFISDFEYSDFAVWDYNNRFASYSEKFGFSADIPCDISRNSYEILCDDLEYLIRKYEDFKNDGSTLLKYCGLPEYSENIRAELENCLSRLKAAVYKLKNDVSLLCEFCGKKIMTLQQYNSCTEMIRTVSGGGILLPEIIGSAEWENLKNSVYSMIMKGYRQRKLKEDILKTFEISVINFDASAALHELQDAENLSDMQKFIKTGRIVKELNSHAREPDSVSRQNVKSFCISLRILKLLSAEIKDVSKDIVELFSSSDGLFKGEKSDWDNMERSVVMSDRLREQLILSPLLSDEKVCFFERLKEYYETEHQKSEIRAIIEELNSNHRELTDLLGRLSDEFRIDFNVLDSYRWQRELAAEADNMINELPKLKQWTEIISIQKEYRI